MTFKPEGETSDLPKLKKNLVDFLPKEFFEEQRKLLEKEEKAREAFRKLKEKPKYKTFANDEMRK